jgi:hypothetical protein
MSVLQREDLIELGVSVPTLFLKEWVSGQIAATKGHEARLEARGVSAEDLTRIRELLGEIERRDPGLRDPDRVPETAELSEHVRAEALGYWREAKRMARTAFAGEPDLLARFRGSVQTGLLLMNLVRVLESTVALLREHAARLGATETFISRGELLIGRLKFVKETLDRACRTFSPDALRQCHDKGLLYDRTRALVRIGRMAFEDDPARASFNFDLVRRDRRDGR